MIVKIVGRTERELDFAVTLVDKIMDNGTGPVEVHYQLAGSDNIMPWDTGFIHDSDITLFQSLGYDVRFMSPCDKCERRNYVHPAMILH